MIWSVLHYLYVKFYNLFIMNRNKIRLTESQLHKVVKESVKRVLKEFKADAEYPYGFIGWDNGEGYDNDFVFAEIVYSDSIDDIPDCGDGIYALTRDGKKIYDEWNNGSVLGKRFDKTLTGQCKMWVYLAKNRNLSIMVR